ncbi:hypothetical protein [Actinomadura nitritigenes]|uniref:hypothetical protein n=1 Tax=Actinomadura nitritigenes TaxID=134602 RepID=UPI003D8B6C98
MNVLDRGPRLLGGLAACRALMAGVQNGTVEGIECLVEARAVVVDEVSVRVLTREEAFEVEEKLVEIGGGCADSLQHRVDGRRPDEALGTADGPVQ